MLSPTAIEESMSNENKIRDAADAVKGVVEAVPIYQDALQPAAKEIGTALQTITKAIHVALAPISALVWGYEKIRDYLNETLTEKLKNVPPERIVTPSPSVAGPTVEALRFAAHEPSLRELYANLLATSMNFETAHNAHPAFVDIIKQLTPDEARIMQCLALRSVIPFIHGYIYMRQVPVTPFGNRVRIGVEYLSSLPKEAPLVYPDLMPTYVGNLERLALVDFAKPSSSQQDKCDWEPLKEEVRKRFFATIVENWEGDRKDFENHLDMIKEQVAGCLFVSTEMRLSLRYLGLQFCKACISAENANRE